MASIGVVCGLPVSHAVLCLHFKPYCKFVTVCSTMIDTNQWRASIGAFNISSKSVRTCIHDKVRCGYDCVEFMEYKVSSTCNYSIAWFLSVYYVLNVVFQMCLILSGDIETNPGPITTKTCPSCDAQIHIRKNICICGYAFNQNYQNLKAVNTFPICASPSSYTGLIC